MAKKKSTATRRAESSAASERAAAIREAQARKERRTRSLVVTGVGVVVLAVVLAIGIAVQRSNDATGAAAATPAGAAGYAVPVGPASAPVHVTVYEDFLCPFCGQFEAASRSRLQSDIATGKVQVRYQVLNFLTQSSTTDYSLRSANALAVVLDTSGTQTAKKFHDLLYENQPSEGSAGLKDSQLIDYAVQAGASRGKVSDPIVNGDFEQWVKNGTSRASKAGVTQTPTVKIDGKQVQGTTVADLAAQVERAVDQAS